MKEERIQILRMLEEGKIKADEAFQLLNTLEENKTTPAVSQKRFLRVRVNDGSDTKVNLNIPIQLARVAMRFIPKDALEKYPELDIDALVKEIAQGAEGKLIEVRDGDTLVEIVVE